MVTGHPFRTGAAGTVLLGDHVVKSQCAAALRRERQMVAALDEQAAAGGPVNAAEFDWSNVAEQIESVGHTERAALSGRIGNIIIEHLIKQQSSPATKPHGGETIQQVCNDAESLLENSPRLSEPWMRSVYAGCR